MNKGKGKILIVDDNKSLLKALELLLTKEFELIQTISNPNLIPETIRANDFDIVLLDMNYKAGLNTGTEGLYWLKEIQKFDKDIVVIMITAYGDINLAVNTMKEGATDFILKPWEDSKLLITLKNALKLRESKREIGSLKQKQKHLINDMDKPYSKIIGNSPAMQEIFRKIKKVSKTDANILLLGENGTGKELIAREIHRQSLRKDRIFFGVDLGAISETLFESELFGHTKGAFTDAKEERAGKFESASKGTIFLDEIGNLSLNMQAKLLSVLEKRFITKVGADIEIPIDVRIISATNQDLKKLINNNQFREDLLYRINTIEIEIPPLRERQDDIIEIANHYLKIYESRYKKENLTLDENTLARLQKYHWPGNIRELRHAIEKAVILTESNKISISDLSIDSEFISPADKLSLDEIEKHAILKVLKKNKWNHSHAANELKIARTTLIRKLKKYGLHN
ncbi:MAG: sigma-54 dependent transcriptional regulator [Bacteroidales bacterium]|nr:sigma-54 dependent transcriptional regulator [Bacteroidales bacterium]